MTTEGGGVARRTMILGAGGLLATVALTACTPHPAASAAASVPGTASAEPAGDLVMIIRHAEKPTGSGAPYGATPDGVQDVESLTIAGWTRAGALVGLFAPVSDDGVAAPLRAGLARPLRVIAANPSHGSARPFQTVGPVASRLGITIDTTWKKSQEEALAQALRIATGSTLVAWEHEAIPSIVTGMGNVTPAPPASWPGSRFDLVWTFRRTGSGWAFAEVPQFVVAGDRSVG